VLAGMGLCLENSLYHPQLAELAAFARAVPELIIILNHIGGLVRVGSYANRDDDVLPAWRRGIAAVAACPNVIIKLGGVGTAPVWLRLAGTRQAHRLGRAGRGAIPLDAVLYRAIRPRPLHVRK
jgi:predicted TIM-barrel fold metal-dependent hydrolase